MLLCDFHSYTPCYADRSRCTNEEGRGNTDEEGLPLGVATSAFQLEGSPNADWSSWDSILSQNPEVTNHYAMYKEDLSLLKDLGVNAYRFSLEWSRIQPKENVWDSSVIDHYQEIIGILKSYHVEPMLTLHHFTHPSGSSRNTRGTKMKSVPKFLEFVERIVSSIKACRIGSLQ